MTPQNRKKAARAARKARARGNGQGRFSLARNLNDLGTSAQGAVRSGRQAVTSAYRMASGLSRSLPSARDMVPRAPNLQRIVDNNPLLVGAVGIGVGLLLGALLPIGQGGGSWSAQPSPASGKTGRARRKGGARPARRKRAPAGGKTDETAAGT